MTAAADVYEIVLYDTDTSTTGLRARLARMFMRRAAPSEPGGVIISVTHRESGAELFRHIEDSGDDEDHLLSHIKQDLGAMTADAFAVAWGGRV